MSKTPERQEQSSGSEARRLDSWKEIASFLRRGIRTVQRWEREEGLPVHRLPHAERGSVFADPNELTAWWERRQIKPQPETLPHTDRDPDLQRVTTSTAATFWPALSSDARMVVYVSDAGQDGATPQLWLQQIGGSAVQLTSGLRDCSEPSFFANDTRVAFDAAEESARNVYEIPTLGGTPRVLKQAARGARFSPDGKWLAYLALEPGNPLRLVPADGGAARTLAHGLVDIVSASWSDDGSCLLVVAHPDASVELDCWVVPVSGASPVDTGVFRRARQQGLIVITLPPAWAGDSVFYCAAGRQGLHLWRQRLASGTYQAATAPELITPGGDFSFFPSVARGRLSFVGVHADVNLWSVAIDAASGHARGPLRRLTRGAGIVSQLTLSRDGQTAAYFAARSEGGELHVRDLDSGTDTMAAGAPAANRWFPAISPDGERVAFSAIVPGPPVQRPVWIASLVSGDTRLVRDDCGGRPRQWLDDRTVLIETFATGLNTLIALDVDNGTQCPLLSSMTRRISNPRLSPDGRWLAFDAATPGGLPSVAIAYLDGTDAAGESEWVTVGTSASHPFWSRDGRLLYYLPVTPRVDIRNRVAARPFDPTSGRLDGDPFIVLNMSEMIVPAMLPAVAPIAAPDQIIFVLGDFRGDIWIRDV